MGYSEQNVMANRGCKARDGPNSKIRDSETKIGG